MNKTQGYMKDSGQGIKGMAMDTRDTRMITRTLESFRIINLRGKEYIHGKMEKYTRGSGTRAKKKAMEFGEESMEIAISENGKVAKQKDMEYIYGRMGINTRESGVTALNMVTVLIFLETVILSKVSINMANLMALANTNGETAHSTLVISDRGSSTEKESGVNLINLNQILTRVSTIWTRSMVMEYLLGNQEICIKEITRMTREMDMERCTGPMGQSTKESGREDANMALERCCSLMEPYLKAILI